MSANSASAPKALRAKFRQSLHRWCRQWLSRRRSQGDSEMYRHVLSPQLMDNDGHDLFKGLRESWQNLANFNSSTCFHCFREQLIGRTWFWKIIKFIPKICGIFRTQQLEPGPLQLLVKTQMLEPPVCRGELTVECCVEVLTLWYFSGSNLFLFF